MRAAAACLISRALALCGLTLLAGGAASARAQPQPQLDERAVKAAYIYNFIQFTQWPSAPGDPFVLCVLGTTPLDDALGQLAGRPVLSGQRIRVQHLQPRDAVQDCHALYLDDTQRPFASDMLQRARSQPTLTITDSEELSQRGAMIEIVRTRRKLGFEVDLHAAREARLTFSARMLKLASFVVGAG